MENKRQIELIIASLFLITLILVTIAIFSLENQTKIKYSSNSVVIQTINYPSKITKCEVTRIPYEVYTFLPQEKTVQSTEYQVQRMSYEDSSKSYTKIGMFNEEIQTYEVKVKNTGCSGGYFKVQYSFTTLCGEKREEFLREYIHYNQEKTFVYKNIQGDREKISSWNYQIISETESCSKTNSEVIPKNTVKETRYKDEVVCFKV